MAHLLAGYDEWLLKQADDYMSQGDYYDCQDNPDWESYEDDCGECMGCKARAKEDYDEARADYLHDRMKEEGW